MNLSANSIGFIAGVFMIALICWYIRTLIESNPEPFFLSFTFFAFAGQFIRLAEVTSGMIKERRMFDGWGTMVFCVSIGGLLVFAQKRVMNGHRWITKHHYKTVLSTGLVETNNLTREKRLLVVDSWSEVLLRITDVDLFPRGYAWLKRWFPEKEEPKERSREFALTVLPRQEFVVSDGDDESALNFVVADGGEKSQLNNGKQPKPITVNKLEVPPTLKRHLLWWAYVAVCVLSWVLFVGTMSIVEPQHFVTTSR